MFSLSTSPNDFALRSAAKHKRNNLSCLHIDARFPAWSAPSPNLWLYSRVQQAVLDHSYQHCKHQAPEARDMPDAAPALGKAAVERPCGVKRVGLITIAVPVTVPVPIIVPIPITPIAVVIPPVPIVIPPRWAAEKASISPERAEIPRSQRAQRRAAFKCHLRRLSSYRRSS